MRRGLKRAKGSPELRRQSRAGRSCTTPARGRHGVLRPSLARAGRGLCELGLAVHEHGRHGAVRDESFGLAPRRREGWASSGRKLARRVAAGGGATTEGRADELGAARSSALLEAERSEELRAKHAKASRLLPGDGRGEARRSWVSLGRGTGCASSQARWSRTEAERRGLAGAELEGVRAQGWVGAREAAPARLDGGWAWIHGGEREGRKKKNIFYFFFRKRGVLVRCGGKEKEKKKP